MGVEKMQWNKAFSLAAMAMGIAGFLPGASSALTSTPPGGQQQQGQTQQGEQGQQGGRAHQAGEATAGVVSPAQNDSRIARWLLIGNQMEIEAAKVAKEKASNAEVKQFADMMIADHEKAVSELKKLISEKGGMSAYPPKGAGGNTQGGATSGGALQDNTPERSRTAVVTRDDGQSRYGKMMYMPVDFVSLKEELAEKCKNDRKEAMEQLSGEEFDKVYMGHQVVEHKEMLATLKAVRSSASSEFQQSIDRHVQTVQTHLDHAKKLCDQVCKKR